MQLPVVQVFKSSSTFHHLLEFVVPAFVVLQITLWCGCFVKEKPLQINVTQLGHKSDLPDIVDAEIWNLSSRGFGSYP